MEQLHRCPHCDGALDDEGEAEVAAEKARARRYQRLLWVAEGRLRQERQKHWYFRWNGESVLAAALFVLLFGLGMSIVIATGPHDVRVLLIGAVVFVGLFLGSYAVMVILVWRLTAYMSKQVYASFAAQYPKHALCLPHAYVV